MAPQGIAKQDHIFQPLELYEPFQELGKILHIGLQHRHTVDGKFRHQNLIALFGEKIGNSMEITQAAHQSV